MTTSSVAARMAPGNTVFGKDIIDETRCIRP